MEVRHVGGLPESETERRRILRGDKTGRSAYFRLDLEIAKIVSLPLDVSANSRCRLWVDGVSVCSGPCKGDLTRCCYETAGVRSVLTPGGGLAGLSGREPLSHLRRGHKPLAIVGTDTFMDSVDLLRRLPMKERPIPLLYETNREFVRQRRNKNGALLPDAVRRPAGIRQSPFPGSPEAG